MKKTTTVTILFSLFCILSHYHIAKAASPEIGPQHTASFSVTLSKYSSTQMEVKLVALFSSSDESCTLNATLQRKVNGTWYDYKYFSSSGKGQSVVLNKKTEAGKGYTYRVKGTLNSTNFSNIVRYSSELSW